LRIEIERMMVSRDMNENNYKSNNILLITESNLM